MLISPAYAQSIFGGGGGDGMSSTLVQIAPLALIFVVFYFLLIRPQQQKAKQQKAMLSAVKRGDRIVTGGGAIGTVAKVVNDDEILVDLSENVRVRILRSTIASVLSRSDASKIGKDDDDSDSTDADKTKARRNAVAK